MAGAQKKRQKQVRQENIGKKSSQDGPEPESSASGTLRTTPPGSVVAEYDGSNSPRPGQPGGAPAGRGGPPNNGRGGFSGGPSAGRGGPVGVARGGPFGGSPTGRGGLPIGGGGPSGGNSAGRGAPIPGRAGPPPSGPSGALPNAPRPQSSGGPPQQRSRAPSNASNTVSEAPSQAAVIRVPSTTEQHLPDWFNKRIDHPSSAYQNFGGLKVRLLHVIVLPRPLPNHPLLSSKIASPLLLQFRFSIIIHYDSLQVVLVGYLTSNAPVMIVFTNFTFTLDFLSLCAIPP